MKRLRWLNNYWFRLAVCVGLAGLLFIAHFYTLTKNHQTIDRYAEVIGQVSGKTNTSVTELQTAPEPISIELGQKGSTRNYSALINALRDRLKMDYPGVHPTISQLLKDTAIINFNEVVASPGFAESLKNANYQLSATLDLLAYHSASMRVLANILEYDPYLDTSLTDNEQLVLRLAAAGEGLTLTSQRIDELKGYDDKSKTALKDYVGQVDTARQAYQTALIEGRSSETEKQAYIAAFIDVQQGILANRQAFWVESRDVFISQLVINELDSFSRKLYR